MLYKNYINVSSSDFEVRKIVSRTLFVTLLILCIFSCQPKHDLPITIELYNNWEFKKATDSVWKSATVPGNVFSDLLENELIEDPFIGEPYLMTEFPYIPLFLVHLIM